VLGPKHADDEIVAEDRPYAEDASPTAQLPKYVPESDLEAHPEDDDDEDPEEDPVDYPADGGDEEDDEEGSSEDDGDDDMDIEADEEEEDEEHPAPADSVVIALTAADQAPSAEETETFETDESAATPSPHPAYRMTSRISIPAPVPVPACPIRSLGYRAAMIRLRAEAVSTSHSPPLPPPFILSPTRSDTPSSGTPLLLPISASTSSPPLQLPSASRREDRPEVTLPPRKRLGIALGPEYEVGESSSAAAARPAGGLRADYGFVATMDGEIMCDPEREVGYGITDSWDEIVETLYGAPVSIDTELGGYIREFETRVRQDTEEIYMRLSREAWVRLTDASDLVRGEVMSLRTTVLGQMTEIRELHAADRRRQIVILEMLRADHRRSTEIIRLRTTLQGHVTALQGQVIALQAQVTALQGHQGLAGGPTQPELPEEAAEAASTSHSPPLPSPFILSPTISDAPSSGTPLLLPISASTSSPPLQLPSASRREDRLEVTLPPRKRLCIALGPGYEGAPVSTDTELGGYMREFEMRVRQDTEEIYMRDRRAHAYTRHLMETKARLSREAWIRSTDMSDLVRGEVMSLRTTVLGQMTEIRELHAADRRRQIVILELLRADHRRSTEIIELRTDLQGQVIALQAQVTALQGQQGLAGGPTQSELPEEAGSGS
nr:hypothetical protein [Tanacetum cinerariifolium]